MTDRERIKFIEKTVGFKLKQVAANNASVKRDTIPPFMPTSTI